VIQNLSSIIILKLPTSIPQEKLTLSLKNLCCIAIALVALNVSAAEPASSKVASSANSTNGATWVEVDDGAEMNTGEFNQHTDSRRGSTFCNKGECDSSPHLIKGNAPKYPIKLLRDEITGQVMVNLEIKSATRQEFAESVIAAIREWEFHPASLQGKPVEMRVQQLFPFELR
jgi:outer membrane biosynthesis protein TonB